MAEERVVIRLILDTSGFRKGANQASSATDKVTKSASKTTKSFLNMDAQAKKLGKTLLAAFAVKKIFDFAKASVQAATDLAESVNAVEKVFGNASASVVAFGAVSAQAVGLAASEFNSLAVNTGALLTNFGFTQQEAANQSIRLGIRAADMASVFNTDVADALNAVNAGLRGETEPLRRFGVSLDDAGIKAKAVELGLAATTAEVDKHAKATAALALIYDQTSKLQGDFAETSMDLANAQRIAAAEAENARAAFGQAFAPVVADLTNFATDALLAFQKLGGSELAAKSIAFREAMDNIREGSDLLNAGNFAPVADAIGHVAAQADLASGDILALGSAAGLSIPQMEDLGRGMVAIAESAGFSATDVAELEDAFAGLTPAADDAAGGTTGFADAAEAAADAANEANEAAREYLNTLAESVNPALKAVNALTDLEEANEVVSKLQKSGKEDTDEFRLAQLELAAQVFETEQALQDFSGGGVEESIGAIALALGISRTAAEELLTELGLLDGLTVTQVVDTKFTTSGTAFQSTLGPGQLSQRKHGGPVRPNEPYIVGEEGPEVFIPDTAGRVVATAASPATTTLGSGEGDVALTIVNPIAENVEDDVRRGLQTAGFLRGAN